MKIIYSLIITITLLTAETNQKYNTSKLNPCLKSLFTILLNNESLIGETHTCNLKLKYANNKWLLFDDGYVRLDSSTRYSFLHFSKNYKLPNNINNFKNVIVTFKIISISDINIKNSYPSLGVILIKIVAEKEINKIQH